MPGRTISPPNEKQKAFFTARTRFVAYGGARGGGKSWAVRRKAALMAMRYPGIRMLLLRRSFPELRENHILPLLADLQGIARYKESEKAFLFPNGSRLRFGYCDGEADVLQYQGQEFDVIFLDEATQFTKFQYDTLTACLRGANPFPKRMYLTCNPGGVGHEWVKRLFITRRYENGEDPDDYTFIPAKVYDNKALLGQDPGYVRMLENLPDALRRAWLDGDWNVFAGQYFTEWREDIHLLEPFPIPVHWRRYFTMDYGLDMLAGYWIALDERGRAYVYRELWKPGLLISDAAREILRLTNESVYAWLAPPDLWNRRQDTGKSVAELFADQGIALVKARNERVAGWLNLKEWLKPIPDGNGGRTANLRVFRSCPHLIESVPALQFDRRNPSDCATEPHEFTHGPDAIRYFAAGRPCPAAIAVPDGDTPPAYEEQADEFLSYGG
nr:MAG: terminase large subunit [Caudoviricetes sp.]